MRPLELHSVHAALGARFQKAGGNEVVATYGDSTAEAAALRQRAGLVDLSFRDRLCLVGPDRIRFLNGQVTQDVKALAIGRGCYAALITAKGRMVSDLNLHVLADEVLVDCEPGFGTRVAERLSSFIIADDVQVIDVTPHCGLLSVQGPGAADAVMGIAPALPREPFEHVVWKVDDLGEACLISHPRGGSAGFDLFLPPPALAPFWNRLAESIRRAGGCPVGWEALELLRIEQGIPRFGADMDETNLPPEAGIEKRAISYTKGCYTGQEIIARLRTYGHVNRRLCGLRWPLEAQVFPKPGDRLWQGDRAIGHVTSLASSEALRSNIALGYIRREADRIGTTLTLRGATAEVTATLVELPFTANP